MNEQVQVSKEAFFAAIADLAAVDPMPKVVEASLANRLHESIWEAQRGHRKFVGRTVSDSYGQAPMQFWLDGEIATDMPVWDWEHVNICTWAISSGIGRFTVNEIDTDEWVAHLSKNFDDGPKAIGFSYTSRLQAMEACARTVGATPRHSWEVRNWAAKVETARQ